MKISGFVCVLNPEYWSFPYLEAIQSYLDCFDEVVVVDGGSTDGSLEKIKKIPNWDKIKIVHLDWPWEYKQREYSKHYNFGFDNCTGDWIFKLDCDWIFHETDIKTFRNQLELQVNNPNIMAVTMPKLTMLNRSRYHFKGKMINGIHMKFYRDKIKSGVIQSNQNKSDWTDLIRVKKEKDGVYYGDLIPNKNVMGIDLTIYNYDCFFRNKEKCKVWYERAAKAYRDESGYPLYGEEGKEWEMWCGMMRMRMEQVHSRELKITAHPKYIREKLNNMTSDQWGYDNFNWDL